MQKETILSYIEEEMSLFYAYPSTAVVIKDINLMINILSFVNKKK